MANQSQKIRRDALEMSGLRASLQRRDAGSRKAAHRAYRALPLADYARIHEPRPAIAYTRIDGVRYRVVRRELGMWVTKPDAKGAARQVPVTFVSVVPA